MLTTVYDGHCVICKSTRATLTPLDWRDQIEWMDLHAREDVLTRYPWLDIDQAMGEIHVIDEAGEVYAGYFGVRRMLRAFPLTLPIWAVLQLPGMDWLGQRVYRFIARNRYAINRAFGVEVDPCADGVCKIPQ